ncbi:hypothetical protein M413DRAFT_11160 [Hebeloma cylindrosporum]|uniref:Uncharacterized protein n=1 Tax=Hebeloma cylindrosporum TaxID=76867 RepID=A0A0C3BW40_HEBCY|nr:hypothetical protein M413DRAFT_11160 [Hebeloma cylindrosporum h7]
MDATKGVRGGIATLTSIARADIRRDAYELIDRAYELSTADEDDKWRLYRRFWISLLRENTYRDVKNDLVKKAESLKTVELQDHGGLVRPMSLAVGISKEDSEMLVQAASCFFRLDMSDETQFKFQTRVESVFIFYLCVIYYGKKEKKAVHGVDDRATSLRASNLDHVRRPGQRLFTVPADEVMDHEFEVHYTSTRAKFAICAPPKTCSFS